MEEKHFSPSPRYEEDDADDEDDDGCDDGEHDGDAVHRGQQGTLGGRGRGRGTAQVRRRGHREAVGGLQKKANLVRADLRA